MSMPTERDGAMSPAMPFAFCLLPAAGRSGVGILGRRLPHGVAERDPVRISERNLLLVFSGELFINVEVCGGLNYMRQLM